MSVKMLSVVTVLRNAASDAPAIAAALLHATATVAAARRMDHELLVIDDGSTDGTFEALETVMAASADMRAISLVSSGNPDVASLAGMEHALGDWVVLIDPYADDPALLGPMLDALLEGADVALAAGVGGGHGAAYAVMSHAFVRLFRAMSGIDLRSQAGTYRGISKRVVTFITSHDNAAAAHRALPMLGGFRTAVVPAQDTFQPPATRPRGQPLRGGARRALALMTSTTSAPLRMATATSAVAAALSLAYSVYVALVYLAGPDLVAPGWTTMSLQLSGMFFLLAVSVGLLSEYVLQISASSSGRPPYHMAREAHSAVSREKRLNVV